MENGSEDSGYRPRQIAEWLSLRITSGGLKPGDPVPSAEDLIERFRVSGRTAEAALRSLQADGLIEIDLDMQALVVAAKAVEAARCPEDGPVTASTAELREIRYLLAQLTRTTERD